MSANSTVCAPAVVKASERCVVLVFGGHERCTKRGGRNRWAAQDEAESLDSCRCHVERLLPPSRRAVIQLEANASAQAAGDVFVTVAVVPEVHILPPTFVNGLIGIRSGNRRAYLNSVVAVAVHEERSMNADGVRAGGHVARIVGNDGHPRTCAGRSTVAEMPESTVPPLDELELLPAPLPDELELLAPLPDELELLPPLLDELELLPAPLPDELELLPAPLPNELELLPLPPLDELELLLDPLLDELELLLDPLLDELSCCCQRPANSERCRSRCRPDIPRKRTRAHRSERSIAKGRKGHGDEFL